MDSKIFKLPLPREEIRRFVKAAPGMRFSTPPEGSIWNPFDREDRNKEICSMRTEGATIDSIAGIFKLHERHIRKILKANGLTTAKEPKTQVEEIKMMLDMGMGVTAISRKLDVSRECVYQHMRKAGIPCKGRTKKQGNRS